MHAAMNDVYVQNFQSRGSDCVLGTQRACSKLSAFKQPITLGTQENITLLAADLQIETRMGEDQCRKRLREKRGPAK
jgi:hypothetical protein